MAEQKDNRKFWFVEFPTYRYNEDVKKLARAKGVRIRDARFKEQTDEKLVLPEAEAPKLSFKKEYAKKEKA